MWIEPCDLFVQSTNGTCNGTGISYYVEVSILQFILYPYPYCDEWLMKLLGTLQLVLNTSSADVPVGQLWCYISPCTHPAYALCDFTINIKNIRQTSSCLTNAMSASYKTTYVGFNSSSVLIKLNGSEDPCSGCRITPGSESMLYPLDNPAS